MNNSNRMVIFHVLLDIGKSESANQSEHYQQSADQCELRINYMLEFESENLNAAPLQQQQLQSQS